MPMYNPAQNVLSVDRVMIWTLFGGTYAQNNLWQHQCFALFHRHRRLVCLYSSLGEYTKTLHAAVRNDRQLDVRE